jgi:hypothetical protein
MKYILTQQETNGVIGPCNSIQQQDDGYECDGIFYSTSVTGAVVKSEVDDDYVNPAIHKQTIDVFNAQQSQLREEQYKLKSDPIFFQYQRGSKTEQEWLDAVNAIKTQLPYKV